MQLRVVMEKPYSIGIPKIVPIDVGSLTLLGRDSILDIDPLFPAFTGCLLGRQDGKGSMTLLGWLWEQDGSLQYRLRKVGVNDSGE